MLEKSSLRPELIYSTTSPYSGTINVWQQGKERTLTVEEYPQSVNLDARNLENRFWGKIVSETAKRVPHPKAVLILGLGGGTAAHLFAERFSGVAIDGVEIDPVIVEVGRRFFGLDEVSNLRIITADALKVVRRPKNYPLCPSRYSVIVVDLYVGDEHPPALETREVLVAIKALLSPKGVAAFNWLSCSAPKEFRAKLEGVFDKVEEVGVVCNWGLPPGNILYLCS